MRFSFMCVRAGVKPVSIHCPEYAYLSPKWERIVQVENCICSAFRTILIKRLDLRLLCQTARALLLFTYMMYWCKFRSDEAFSIDNIIYEQSISVYLVFHESFCQTNVNSTFYIICIQIHMYKTRALFT